MVNDELTRRLEIVNENRCTPWERARFLSKRREECYEGRSGRNDGRGEYYDGNSRFYDIKSEYYDGKSEYYDARKDYYGSKD